MLLRAFAPLDPDPKIIGFGPEGRLYITVGPPCKGTGCACGAAVNALLDYCSIAHMWPNGSDFRSLIRG